MTESVQDKLTKCLLLASSLAVFFLLAYAQYRGNFGADWYRHQSEYKRQLLASARRPSFSASARDNSTCPASIALIVASRVMCP